MDIFILSSEPTGAEPAELQALHKELEKAPKPGKAGKVNTTQFFAINEQFHMRLLAVANNRWRDQMVADLRKVMKLNRHNSLLKTGRIEESSAEHQAIMVALLARDAECTQQRMREHFANGLEAAG